MEHKFEIRQMFDDDFKRKVIEEYFPSPNSLPIRLGGRRLFGSEE